MLMWASTINSIKIIVMQYLCFYHTLYLYSLATLVTLSAVIAVPNQ